MIGQKAKTGERRRDSVVEEVRAIRQEHARRFDYDPDAIFEDLKRHQKERGYDVVSFPARGLSGERGRHSWSSLSSRGRRCRANSGA